MNKKIIDQFTKLVKHIKYSKEKDKSNRFRLQQTLNILEILKKYPKEIKNGEELQDIKGIGKNTVARINEILEKGHLTEISHENYEAYEELEQIFGIGKTMAKELIETKKITSIKQLQKAIHKNKIEVPYHVLLGLKYNNAIKQTIPRAEVDQMKQILDKALTGIHFEICGSYRRGKEILNDIDILVTGKTNILETVVKNLKNFIIDDIDKNYEVKYMGFVKLKNGIPRRLDIMYVPTESFYPALIHFTGSGKFNQKLRGVAIELGYKLNQYELLNIQTGKRIKIESEKDIFDKLGMEYVEPKFRY